MLQFRVLPLISDTDVPPYYAAKLRWFKALLKTADDGNVQGKLTREARRFKQKTIQVVTPAGSAIGL